MALLLFIGGDLLAGLFSDDPETRKAIVLYLWLVPIGYGFQGIVMLICSTLNAMHRPVYGTLISSLRLFALTVPLALIGGWLWDTPAFTAASRWPTFWPASSPWPGSANSSVSCRSPCDRCTCCCHGN